MKKITKFSKNINDIFNLKKSLINDNKINLRNTIKINKKYKKLRLRKKCIICNFNLRNIDFISHLIPYSICRKCNHLNGIYLMNDKFNKSIYSSNKGKNFSSKYSDDFSKRVENIYIPKVQFMKKTLGKKIKVLDFGCGAGHFVKGCEKLGIDAIGIDPNEELINKGKKYLKKNTIKKLSFSNSINEILTTNADLLSLIFVLEHLEDPKKIFESFKKSKLSYLYISIPLFSFSVLIENAFQKIYPRQLGGAHTNLYSKESLNFIAKKYKLKIIGEWWFGTDFADLYRNLLISSNYKSNFYKKNFDILFRDQLNTLQHVMDKSKKCSEVHLILKK
jgi:SAM-dependent methyltransferase